MEGFNYPAQIEENQQVYFHVEKMGDQDHKILVLNQRLNQLA
jgi:hypothetical protein